MDPPQNPAGEYVAKTGYSQERRDELIAIIEQAPGALRQAVAGLDDRQLDTRYRNWTIRQIVHHLADSHVHCYVRCKWTITEDLPTIKPCMAILGRRWRCWRAYTPAGCSYCEACPTSSSAAAFIIPS